MARKAQPALEENLAAVGDDVYHYWKFKNPKGAKVRCEAISGTGEIYLYKNNKKIGPRYEIASKPGPPSVVHLNTGSWMDPVTRTVQMGDTLLKIARQYGVSISKLREVNGLRKSSRLYSGMLLRIPDSEWEVWIRELDSEQGKFKVELLPFEQ